MLEAKHRERPARSWFSYEKLPLEVPKISAGTVRHVGCPRLSLARWPYWPNYAVLSTANTGKSFSEREATLSRLPFSFHSRFTADECWRLCGLTVNLGLGGLFAANVHLNVITELLLQRK